MNPWSDELEHAGTAVLDAYGMWCNNCARAVTRLLENQPGVRRAEISFSGAFARLEWDPDHTSLSQILAPARKLGYDFRPASARDRDALVTAEIQRTQLRLAVAVFFGMWIMMSALPRYFDAAMPESVRLTMAWLEALLLAPVLLYAARPFFRAAWRGLRAGMLSMDLLISLGALATTGVSLLALLQGHASVYFDSAAMLIAFLLGGRLIEHQARRKGREAIQSLVDLSPELAHLLRGDGSHCDKPIASIKTGGRVLVLPGERLPIDGRVLSGHSSLDRSLLTGESAPLDVGPGDAVLAGTLNGSGSLVLEAVCTVGYRRVDLILDTVRTALASRSPLLSVAERISALLIPGLLLLALATVLIWGWLSADWPAALLRGASVLVISCPCAIGLALPLALAVGMGRAAELGLLIRDGEAIERVPGIRHLVFDKTGTLTQGRPSVAAVLPAPGVSPQAVLRAAARAEQSSDHPLARALSEACPQLPAEPGDLQALPGLGLIWQAPLDGDRILAGSRRHLQTQGIRVPELPPAAGTEMLVALNGRYLGTIQLRDQLRAGLVPQLRALAASGYTLSLLTGDTLPAARAVADEVGLPAERVWANCEPERKLELIRRLQSDGPVLYVGDGINDGPALAAADIGLSLRQASDTAVLTAGLVIQSGGLERLPELLRLLNGIYRIMRQNLGWAIAYNLLAVPLAIGGHISPGLAALAMVLSSVSVILNTLRLQRLGSPVPLR